MRIATWNLARTPTRSKQGRSALLRLMEPRNADIWVLTETSRDFAPGAGYRLIAASNDAPDRGAGECWVAIWSRLPAAAVETCAELDRTACISVAASADGNSAIIYGTVLPWLSDTRRKGIRGGAAFVASLEEQALDWDRIRRKDQGSHFYVVGDFNQALGARHYYGSKLGRAALERVLHEHDLRCLTAGAEDPLPSFAGRPSVDHICVDAASAAPRYLFDLWPEPASFRKSLTDHYGVLAIAAV
jgi:hypothetical protein